MEEVRGVDNKELLGRNAEGRSDGGHAGDREGPVVGGWVRRVGSGVELIGVDYMRREREIMVSVQL